MALMSNGSNQTNTEDSEAQSPYYKSDIVQCCLSQSRELSTPKMTSLPLLSVHMKVS